MAKDKALRQHLLNMLMGSDAHVAFDAAIKDVPDNLRGIRPNAAEHSLWEVLEHLRITQWDILEFSASLITNRLTSQAGIGRARKRLRTRKPGTRACKPFGRIFRHFANWWPTNRSICSLPFQTVTVRRS